ncbi:NAD(P)H-quinone oxidoreductase subunit [Dirofilaria immitis]
MNWKYIQTSEPRISCGSQLEEEKRKWSEPIVLHVAGKEQTDNLGIAFEELVNKIGESRVKIVDYGAAQCTEILNDDSVIRRNISMTKKKIVHLAIKSHETRALQVNNDDIAISSMTSLQSRRVGRESVHASINLKFSMQYVRLSLTMRENEGGALTGRPSTSPVQCRIPVTSDHPRLPSRSSSPPLP